jgi:nucleoside-diphosphate-sugar epimerase
LETIAGKKLRMKKLPRQAGDVRHTEAELGRARDRLGFNPRVGLVEGLRQEWEWLRTRVK